MEYSLLEDKYKGYAKNHRGPQTENEVYKIVMYLCQSSAAAKLRDIAHYFKLNHAGSVGFIIHQIRHKKKTNQRPHRSLQGLIKNLTS